MNERPGVAVERRMKPTAKLITATLIATVGCSEGPPQGPGKAYAVIIDTDTVTTDEADVIVSALSNWEASVPVTFAVSMAPCSGIQPPGAICIHTAPQVVVGAHSPANPTAIGITDYVAAYDSAEMWIANDTEWSVHQLVEHEVGHAMGLSHHGPGSLMFYRTGPDEALAPTADDVAQWFEVRGGG
jgi:hypothetical protein